MNQDLTRGPVMGGLLRFAVPMIMGDLLQQCYNIADTLIMGRCLGPNALAAVGSSFTLMTFLTSILWGSVWAAGPCSPYASASGMRKACRRECWRHSHW